MVYNWQKNMKKISAVLTVLVFASSVAFAQETPSIFAHESVAFELGGYSSLYAGVDNPITVVANGHDAKDQTLVISSGKGTITKDDTEGSYFVRPEGGQKQLILCLESEGRRLACRPYVVKSIPAPVLSLRGLFRRDSIGREEIKEGDPLVVMQDPSFPYYVDSNLMRFIKIVVACGTDEVTLPSHRLTQGVEYMVSRAAEGSDLVVMADVLMPDGVVHRVTATYHIKGSPKGGPVIYKPVLDDNGDPEVDKNGNLVENVFISMEGIEYYAPHLLIDDVSNGSTIYRNDIGTFSLVSLHSNVKRFKSSYGETDRRYVKGDVAHLMSAKAIIGPKEVTLGKFGELTDEAVKMIHKAKKGDRLILVAHVLMNGTTEMDLYTFYTLK